MPRKVPQEEIDMLCMLIKSGVPQRDIERDYKVSRVYLRKLAEKIGYQFPRNGVENVGTMCVCMNCGSLFTRPQSKVSRAKYSFCSDICRIDFMRGEKSGHWIDGRSGTTFSKWIVNQQEYIDWRELVLEKSGYRCVVSGRTEDLHCHHILFKAKEENYHKALDVDNGIALNKEIHREIHKLQKEGKTFQEALDILKEKYREERESK